ncbi:MAG: hypothetical protein ACFFAO_10220 [Candidatus Hermodarchaeota archaeon]
MNEIDNSSKEIKDIDKKNWLYYLFYGIICWVIVDFTTVFNPNIQRWISYWPTIWLFYILFPLIFSILIYKVKINDKQLFLCTIIEIIISEIILFQNPMLFTFPIMLLAIPFSLCIYTLITFLPKWIVEKKLNENKRIVIFLIIIWILISLITFMTNIQ